jgi:LysM domain
MQANTGLRGFGSLLSAVVRICAVISTEAGLGLGLGWVAAPPLHGGLDAVAGGPTTAPGRTLEVLVVSVAGCLAWLALGLLVASTAATVLLATVHTLTAPAPPLRRLCGPMWWRRAVLGACGLSLVAPVAAIAAHQGDGLGARCRGSCAVASAPRSQLSGLEFPDLPDVVRTQVGAGTRTVRPGDSLWLIARDMLRPAAPDSAVCREVDALYAANRRVVGPDPDLIFPGTELKQPGGTA